MYTYIIRIYIFVVYLFGSWISYISFQVSERTVFAGSPSQSPKFVNECFHLMSNWDVFCEWRLVTLFWERVRKSHTLPETTSSHLKIGQTARINQPSRIGKPSIQWQIWGPKKHPEKQIHSQFWRVQLLIVSWKKLRVFFYSKGIQFVRWFLLTNSVGSKELECLGVVLCRESHAWRRALHLQERFGPIWDQGTGGSKPTSYIRVIQVK